jgi:hypothetical protein
MRRVPVVSAYASIPVDEYISDEDENDQESSVFDEDAPHAAVRAMSFGICCLDAIWWCS